MGQQWEYCAFWISGQPWDNGPFGHLKIRRPNSREWAIVKPDKGKGDKGATDTFLRILDELGLDGWELVDTEAADTWFFYARGYYLWFKRQKAPT